MRRAGQKTNGKGFGRTYKKGHIEFRAVSIQTMSVSTLEFSVRKNGILITVKDDIDAANRIKQ